MSQSHSSEGSHLLEVKDLRVGYDGLTVIKGIDFSVQSGAIVSLVGANGAGKTTTLKAVSGLVPWTGEILFEGQSLRRLKAHQIVRLGISHSPEGRGVFPDLTVEENLILGSYTQTDRDLRKKDLDHAIELFPRLKERWKQPAGTMSGGEQQMLAMCRALMSRPRLLILDEPSLGLAPLVVNQIFEIIQKVNRDGMTILLVEQNAQKALEISHHAYVIETGEIVLSGGGKELSRDRRVIDAYLGTM